VDRLIELNQGKDRREKSLRCQGGSVLLAPQTSHRVVMHLEVLGDSSG
jgi:hypothetical protein